MLDILKLEIQKQSKFALISYNYLKESVNDVIDPTLVWYYSQNFLIATANVSMLLWGSESDEINSDYRKQLREILNISEDSLLQNPQLRNTFVHFDKKLLDWSEKSKQQNFCDSNIGAIDAASHLKPEDHFRNFDIASNMLTFKGDTYELQPIINELIKLIEIVNKLLPTSF